MIHSGRREGSPDTGVSGGGHSEGGERGDNLLGRLGKESQVELEEGKIRRYLN